MEIPLKVEVKQTLAGHYTELSHNLDHIIAPEKEFNIKIWTVRNNGYRQQLVEYDFWATRSPDRPIGSDIGQMTLYDPNSVYEEAYLRRLRDEINMILGDT